MRRCVAYLFLIIHFFLAFACSKVHSLAIKFSPASQDSIKKFVYGLSDTERKFEEAGLIKADSLIDDLKFDLRYSSTNNITGVDLYGRVRYCYLPLSVALKLKAAHEELKRLDSSLTFLVWDAARPLSVQRLMWDTLKIPGKINYLSHPDSISLHNYGAAIDLTIYDLNGKELDMGTSFDHFGREAQPRLETTLLYEQVLTKAQIENRTLLRSVMKKGGFWPIPTEWWHFNAANKKWAAANMRLIK